MKKLILILLLLLWSFSFANAYEPKNPEVKTLNLLTKLIEKQSNLKWELWIKRQTYLFTNALNTVNDERKKYILNYVLSDMNANLVKIQQKNEEKLKIELEELELKKQEDLKSTKDYNEKAKLFFELYWKNITTSLEINEKCTKYFDFVDEIAKKNNFPTELVIATWSKESNCNLSNPANTWWPFQITSAYYTPWDITLEDFWVAVQKYIDFTKGKWDYFNNNTYHNYKTRFWSENIAITYDNYSLRDLKLSAILYNWVSSNTTLDWNTFANSNLDSSVITNSDWLVTRFLKILNWRTKK